MPSPKLVSLDQTDDERLTLTAWSRWRNATQALALRSWVIRGCRSAVSTHDDWWRDMIPEVGDEVVVSLDPASAHVRSVGARHITIEWPWGTVDNSSDFRWDGTCSLPSDDIHPEWVPYQLEPAARELRAGDACTVSIPPTRLHVVHYEAYDPPRNLGWAPAPTAGIYVVPPENRDEEDAGCMLYLGGAEPIRIDPADD